MSLDEPIGHDAATATRPAAPAADRTRLAAGDQLGRFTILRLLGSGGMGEVYEARDWDLDRAVAVKVLATDRDRSEHQRRLLREAQALAQLQHPNVVAVHEVGIAAGRTFIAMELIDGVPLHQFLADRPPRWRQVVALFVQAGRGLAAAHAKGIVHRDFKPGNVLVDRDGRARVTDFGLARFADSVATPMESAPAASPDIDGADTVDSDGSDTAAPAAPGPQPASALGTPLTQAGALLGTPRYMAPEQYARMPATPATDQFSFCVALWEALLGQHPFGAITDRAALATAVSTGRPVPPPRGRAPRWLIALVGRGLRHDPAQRYPSMVDLIARLEQAPVRRRRAAIAVLSLGLVGGVAAGAAVLGTAPDPCATVGDRIATVWNRDARSRVANGLTATGLSYAAETSARVVDALDRHAQSWSSMRVEACRAIKVRGEQSADLFDRRMSCLDDRLAAMGGLIDVYATADAAVVKDATRGISALGPVTDCADRAMLLERLPRPTDPALRARADQVSEAIARADASITAGRRVGIIEDAERLTAVAREVGWPPAIARAQYLVARARFFGGEYAAAAPVYRDAALLAARAREDALTVQALRGQALSLRELAKFDDGLDVLTDAELMVARTGDAPSLVVDVAGARGYLLGGAARFAESEAEFQRALAVLDQEFPDDRLRMIDTMARLGFMLSNAGDYLRADQILQRALDLAIAELGTEHPTVSVIHRNRAGCLLQIGASGAAARESELALAIQRKTMPATHPAIAASLQMLALIALIHHRHDDAERFLAEAKQINAAAHAPDHPSVLDGEVVLAVLRRDQGRRAEAIALNRDVIARARAAGISDDRLAEYYDALGDTLVETGNPREAVEWIRRGLEARNKVQAGPADVAASLASLARAHQARGDCEAAVRFAHDALSTLDKDGQSDNAAVIEVLQALHPCQRTAGLLTDARATLERLVALLERSEDWRRATTRFDLARLLWQIGDRPGARTVATQAIQDHNQLGTTAERQQVEAWLAAHAGER